METEKQYISLSKLQSVIKDRLEAAMPLPCWVAAEISEMKVNYSGHCYLELVEKGGDNQVPRAKVSAVIWRSTFGAVSSFFRSTTGKDISEGMKVLMKVSVNYHELYGLSLVVSDIDPLYTLGDMERQRQQTILRLQEEGVFDMNRSLDLPGIIQRVAIISSRNAAGYQDFMQELGSAGYYFKTELFDSFMQGHAAEDSVIEALESVLERIDEFDVVVLIRGGGSQSDLTAFSSYRLCSHIAQFPIPVIAGIGHDKDQNVADMVCNLSLKTPTAVATYLVNNLTEFDSWLDSLGSEVVQAAVTQLENSGRRLREAALRLSKASSDLTHSLDMKLEKLLSALTSKKDTMITERTSRLQNMEVDLNRTVRSKIKDARTSLDSYKRIIDSRRPENILSLGFAIVRSQERAVTNSSDLLKGDPIKITLLKGSVDATVEKVNE